MSNLLKKIFLSLLAFFVLFASIAPNFLIARAQDTWYSQDFAPWYIKVYDEGTSLPNEIFGERYTAAQVQWVVYSLISMPINFLGKDTRNYVNCMMKIGGGEAVDPGQCIVGVLEVLVKTIKIISPVVSTSDQTPLAVRIFDTTNRPVSGIGYIQKTIDKFTLVKVANAQAPGFGYSHMGLIIPYWKASRDISFVFAIIAVIVFAFMIMFRVKINPQTVITIQSAVPKVMGALILAAFSLAIAGFVIDLMYVISGIFATLMASSGIASSAGRAYTSILGEFKVGGFSLSSITGGPVTIFVVMLLYTMLFFVSVVWNALTSIILSLSLISGSGFTIVGLGLVIWLLILTFWYTLKLTWVLFKTAINIYLSIIIAPLQIMAGVLAPTIGFGLWLKNLIANVLVFPVTGLFIYLAYDFLLFSYEAGLVVGRDGLTNVLNETFGLHPPEAAPDIRLWAPPWLGQDVTGFMFLMISFGLIIMLPKVVDMLKSIIMGEKFAFGTAIGEAFGPIDWARKTAPARAVGDVITAEGAARALTSGPAEWVARKLGYKGEMKDLAASAKEQLKKSR